MTLTVLPSPAAVAEAAGQLFVASARAAVAARGRFTVALSGGSTPEALYRRLAEPAHREQIDWSRLEIFFGDERAVPSEDPRSNFGQAREALLDRVPLPPRNIHRIEGELPAHEAARAYGEELARVFAGRRPRFDLILLGMGDDGHTASLFPGMPALEEDERWVVATDVPPGVDPYVARITLTFPILNAAASVLFVVTGKRKASRVREVLTGADATLPAACVRPADGTLVWLLDAEAASALDRS